MNNPKAMPIPGAGATPRLIPVEQLVEMLHLKTQVTFRVGNAPQGFVEVVSFAGTEICIADGIAVKVAADWWINNRIQRVLCGRN